MTWTWRRRGLLTGLFLLMAGFIAYAIAPASVLPLFMAEFSIDKPTASTSISAIFLTWALLQLPGGFVLDRSDNRRLLLGGALLFLLAAAVGLLVRSYPLFLVTRLVSGASVVFFFVGSVNVLGRTLPEDDRALGLSIFIASPPFGIALSQFAGPRIAVQYGWRTALFAYILLAVLGFLLVVALLREPIEAVGQLSVRRFTATLRNPAVLLVSTASLCTYTVWTFLVTWMPAYGNEVLGFDLAGAGAAAALVPLAGIVARPGGGWLSAHLGGKLRLVIGLSFVASVPLLFGLSRAPSPIAFALLLAAVGAAVNLGVGLYLEYVTALSQAASRATSLSVLVTVSNLGNLAAPVAGGWLIEHLSWTAGFGFAVGLAMVGLAAIAFVPASR